MTSTRISSGVVHKVPKDLHIVLSNNTQLRDIWNHLTPLSRNEWLCYITIVKKVDTREKHILRLKNDLLSGKRRPCCWAGCPHRRDNAKKWFGMK